ncbi:RDD family protein [Tautonia plasticadhaerens]|uniref:RDD family protein n=1 Tax=Tautonia plasticadhaerens TaxID=2527974 RepID=A0A518HAN6_9BACT|nr:RDD family protein [Tautonia plasticadhaerens]QDV37914.1 RDD family protein [Tautonia plasticadhaerens]
MTTTGTPHADPVRPPIGGAPGPTPAPAPVTVGLPRRGIALAIDYGILAGLCLAIDRTAGRTGLPPEVLRPTVALACFAASAFYFSLLESSRWRATPGKLAAGVRVLDDDGRRVSFPRALGRTFAKLLSLAPFGVGLLMAAFSERNRALHDVLAGTVVARAR